jgi:crotonobetainyl-CoA:carnitine CoA-transferase CaiB-like acyl-CoA transferase
MKLSSTPGVVENAPPKFGEHNKEVLTNLGFSEDEIALFEKSRVIAKQE